MKNTLRETTKQYLSNADNAKENLKTKEYLEKNFNHSNPDLTLQYCGIKKEKATN